MQYGRENCGNYSYLWIMIHVSTILWLPRHWIWIMTSINWCSWKNINTEKPQNPNRTTIPVLCKIGKKKIVLIHILGVWAILHYFMITKRINLVNKECKLMWLEQYSPIYIYIKGICGTTISILYKMWETYCGNSSYLWSFSHYPTILWSRRHWISITRN